MNLGWVFDVIFAVELADVNARVAELKNTEEYEQMTEVLKAFREAENAPAKTKIPSRPNMLDGVSRYNDGTNNIGILRKNGKYTIYNYDSKNMTKPLTFAEATQALKKINGSEEGQTRAAKAALDYKITSVNNDVLSLIEDIENGEAKSNSKADLKQLPPSVAKKVQDITGVDVSGFKVVIEARQVEHIIKDHGKNGKTDHSMADPNDIAKMEFAMQSPDSISRAGKTQAYSYMRDGKNRTSDTVLYEKQLGDKSYYVVQAVADTNKKTLYVVSAFIGKSGYKKETSQLIDANKSPNATSKSGSVVVSNKSISNPEEKVNTSDEKISAKGNKYSEANQKAENFGNKKVKGYSALSAPDKARVRRVIRQAQTHGFAERDIITLARVTAHSGLKIEINEAKCVREVKAEDGTTKTETVRGLYDTDTGVIYINPKYKVSATRILGHEAFHALFNTFKASPRNYVVLQAAINEAAKSLSGVDTKIEVDGKKLTKAERIALAYANETPQVIGEELGAHYAEYFTDETFMKALVGEKPSLKDKILSFFKKAEADYADVSSLSSAARSFTNLYKNMFAAFSEINKYDIMISQSQENTGETRAAFVGVKADTADRMKLSQAEKMLKEGLDSETVRKETGWFVGYDGKWRFEISDADSYLIENPALEKHTEDGEVYFTGKLSDIFNHKELFAAYPDLKDINIVIQKTEFGVDGIYQPNSNYITLSIEQFKRPTKAYYGYANGGRKAEIDSIEASDAYREYNRLYDDEVIDTMEPTEWLEAEATAREKFYSSELGKRYYQLMWGKSGFVGDKFEFGWAKAAKETLMHELQHAVQKREGFASGTNTRDKNYDLNAGEIEARDTARRVNMTAEERKNTRPDIDRTDVVVKKNSNVSYFSKDNKSDEAESIRTQMLNHLDEINEMEPVANINYYYVSKEKARKDALELYKTKGFKIDRQNFGEIELSEKEIKDSDSYVNTSAEAATWMTIPNVLKRGKLISGHTNHKNEGFPTYTIAAPVIINGKLGNVGITVKKTGKYRYKAHRIITPEGSVYVFSNKENAEPTASDILIKNEKGPDISSASNSSITQTDEKINLFSEKSSKRASADLTDTSIGYISTAFDDKKLKQKAQETLSSVKENVKSVGTDLSIRFVNEQAGIEKAGKKLGVGNIEALTQQMRAAPSRAQTALADVQYIREKDGTWRQAGKGLYKIFEPIKAQGEVYWHNFQMYMFHLHNADRMSLKAKSIQKNMEENMEDLQELAKLEARNKQIKKDVAIANGILNGLKGKRDASSTTERQITTEKKKALWTEFRKSGRLGI